MATENKKVATAQPSLEEKVVDIIEVTNAALTKAASAYQVKEAEDRAINAKIPEVVDSLIKSALIEPEDKEAMAKALRDPLQALESVKLASERVFDLRNGDVGALPARSVNADGTPAHSKSAAADRRAQFEADRDAAWDRALS